MSSYRFRFPRTLRRISCRALDLESRGILGEGVSFMHEEKQAAMEMQTVNIANFQGVFGDVQNSTVTQNLMVDKAASGAWQIAFGTAGSLLAQAIYLDYGFN